MITCRRKSRGRSTISLFTIPGGWSCIKFRKKKNPPQIRDLFSSCELCVNPSYPLTSLSRSKVAFLLYDGLEALWWVCSKLLYSVLSYRIVSYGTPMRTYTPSPKQSASDHTWRFENLNWIEACRASRVSSSPKSVCFEPARAEHYIWDVWATSHHYYGTWTITKVLHWYHW